MLFKCSKLASQFEVDFIEKKNYTLQYPHFSNIYLRFGG
jgi:hypothetical protein